MSYQGWLIKFTDTDTLFPHELIAADTYQSTPLQRTEIKAYRDNNSLLHRVTSPNYKTKLKFQTLELTLAQMQRIRNILNAAFINSQQRKLRVTYWDDELLSYRTMTAYMTDTTYDVSVIKRNPYDIRYAPLTLTFIEY